MLLNEACTLAQRFIIGFTRPTEVWPPVEDIELSQLPLRAPPGEMKMRRLQCSWCGATFRRLTHVDLWNHPTPCWCCALAYSLRPDAVPSLVEIP